jgi:PPOX class probable F420-dependent enzyme
MPTGNASQTTGGGFFEPLSRANYMRLTTFRRTGQPVHTPVHVVTDGPVAYFRTWDVSGKAKRLRHTASVEVMPSTFRGRPAGPVLRAEARLLAGQESEHAAVLIARRHPVLHGRLIPWFHRRRGWVTQQYRLDPPRSGA